MITERLSCFREAFLRVAKALTQCFQGIQHGPVAGKLAGTEGKMSK